MTTLRDLYNQLQTLQETIYQSNSEEFTQLVGVPQKDRDKLLEQFSHNRNTSLETKAEKELLKELCALAKSDIPALVELLHEIENKDPLEDDAGILYEAMSLDCTPFSEVIIDDLKRNLHRAEMLQNNELLPDQLQGFYPIFDANVEPLNTQLKKLLLDALQSYSPFVRDFAITLIADFIESTNYDGTHLIIDLYKNDLDVRIRSSASEILKFMVDDPQNYKLSFFDKIKLLFVKPLRTFHS